LSVDYDQSIEQQNKFQDFHYISNEEIVRATAHIQNNRSKEKIDKLEFSLYQTVTLLTKHKQKFTHTSLATNKSFLNLKTGQDIKIALDLSKAIQLFMENYHDEFEPLSKETKRFVKNLQPTTNGQLFIIEYSLVVRPLRI